MNKTRKTSRNADEVNALLAAREAKYRELADIITDPLTIYDANLRLLYRNKASAEATQIPQDQVLGKPFEDIYPHLAGSEVHQAYRLALETRQSQKRLSHWVRPSDGKEFYFDLRIYPTSSGVIALSRDVTENVLAEEARKKSDEKFSITFHSSPVAQAILSASDRKMIDVNETFLEQTGFTRAEAIGHTALELGLFYNPADRERLALPGKNQEIKVRTKTGEIRTQLFSLEPLELDGKVCILMTGIDITDRVRAEEALNERNKALQAAQIDLINERNQLLAVLEALPVGMAILDEKGGNIQANAAYNTVWGENRPDVNAVDDYEKFQAWWSETGQLVQPEEWASARAVQKGETTVGQYMQIRKFDGTRAYVLNSAAPIRDASAAITGCAVAIMDITRLVETENALRESQERFRVALNSVPLMVYTCDREQRYTWIYQPLRGFHPEDVLGKRDDELLSSEAAAELIAAKQLALDSGQGRIQEVNVPVNGEDFYYLLTTDPIRDRQNTVIGLTCSAIDITQQKRLQAGQQEQAVRIEVQRRLMAQREQDRELVARNLHDGPIQTLSSTMFYLQIVKEVFPDTLLQGELDKISQDIKNTIHELRNVLNELRPPALMHFGFSKVTQQYLQDFAERFPGIAVVQDLANDDRQLSPHLHLALFRIFQAGIDNITRHSGARNVRVVFRVEHDGFYFELCDDGRGFAAPKDFSQLTRDGHFGLAGMKERADAIDAEFEIRSEPGEGTCIVVRGPVGK